MKDELVTYETAKLAEEKGFKISCKEIYLSNGKLYHTPYITYNIKYDCLEDLHEEDIILRVKNLLVAEWSWDNITLGNILAPTQSVLKKWLREVHNIDCNPMKYTSGGYWIDIQRGVESDSNFYKTNLTGFKTYEEALEKGLYEALKLIK